MPTIQGRYFIATISCGKSKIIEETGEYRSDAWLPCHLHADNESVVWVKGQLEIGENGFEHYQLIFAVKSKTSIVGALKLFPKWLKPHLELTRSKAAESYVCKDETKVPDTEFEYGVRPLMMV